jgi:hypothetical protein
MTSPNRSVEASFGPIRAEPIVVDTTASTTPAALSADLSDAQWHRVRRVFIYNKDATDSIALIFKPNGTNWAASGLDVTDGLLIPPGQFRQVAVSSALSLGVVASANTPAFNALISDT